MTIDKNKLIDVLSGLATTVEHLLDVVLYGIEYESEDTFYHQEHLKNALVLIKELEQ